MKAYKNKIYVESKVKISKYMYKINIFVKKALTKFPVLVIDWQSH